MPDAHAAAVEAMAGALHARMVSDDLWGMPVEEVDREADARAAMEALTSSAAVRAALVEALDTAVVEYSGRRKWYGADLVSAYTDAILAALAPGEAT